MLTGWKTWIGIAVWAIGAVLVEFLGVSDIGELLKELGQLIAAGGFTAKLARFMKSQKIK